MKIKYPERVAPYRKSKRDKYYPYVVSAAVALALILLYMVEVGG